MHTQMGEQGSLRGLKQIDADYADGSRGRGAEMHVPELPAARYTLKAISS